MTLDNSPRIRLNAKQTAKGLWQFDVTVEYHEEILKVANEDDAANITNITLGEKLLEQVKSAEKAFRDDGRKLVSDD